MLLPWSVSLDSWPRNVMFYRRMTGTGPKEGWVQLLRPNGIKPLLVKTELRPPRRKARCGQRKTLGGLASFESFQSDMWTWMKICSSFHLEIQRWTCFGWFTMLEMELAQGPWARSGQRLLDRHIVALGQRRSAEAHDSSRWVGGDHGICFFPIDSLTDVT